MSIIDEAGEKFVRMAHLACVGSKHINGVAELHTQLLRDELLRDFHNMWPNKFINVTNGVTPRRWLAVSNPEQATLMTSKIGDTWIRNLDHLKNLETFAEMRPSVLSGERCGTTSNPASRSTSWTMKASRSTPAPCSTLR